MKKITNSRKQFLKRKSIEDQEQKNFKKVGDFLSIRLRKILLDKYGGANSKRSNKTCSKIFRESDTANILTETTRYKPTCRTAGLTKRVRIDTSNGIKRAKTSEVNARATENVWKNRYNCKINDILSDADN